jgi:hypothetical protein
VVPTIDIPAGPVAEKETFASGRAARDADANDGAIAMAKVKANEDDVVIFISLVP